MCIIVITHISSAHPSLTFSYIKKMRLIELIDSRTNHILYTYPKTPNSKHLL